MHLSKCFLLAFAALGAHGIRRRADSTTFQLYIYGPEVGGLPVFYDDGFAYAGNPNNTNSTQSAIVTFSTATDGTWTGSPNTTDLDSNKTPTWSNVTLYIPSTGSTSSRIGFANSSTVTSGESSGFLFYGNTAMFIGDDGMLASSWTALKGDNDVYALYWNDTSAGQVPVTLRSVAPSNPPPPPHTTGAFSGR